MSIRLEKVKTRIYFVGDTYTVKDRIKAMGGHWDGERRQWWVGSAKAKEAEALRGKLEKVEPAKESPRDIEVIGKATYKGRTYYVRWVGECKSGDYKCRLATLDAKLDFWAACARPGDSAAADEAVISKTYRDRQTLAGLAKFAADKKAEREEVEQRAKAVTTAAAGEAMVSIPHVTDDRILRAFFGDRAVSYDYTVTHDEFDEYDNEGPGHYYGASVPQSLAAKWDAGINACKATGLETRSREGLLIRYRLMVGDDAAALPAELESVIAMSNSG